MLKQRAKKQEHSPDSQGKSHAEAKVEITQNFLEKYVQNITVDDRLEQYKLKEELKN